MPQRKHFLSNDGESALIWMKLFLNDEKYQTKIRFDYKY